MRPPIDSETGRRAAFSVNAFAGTVSYQTITAYIAAEQSDGSLALCRVLDLSNCSTDVKTGDVNALVYTLREVGVQSRIGRTAIVGKDDLTFGVFNMLVLQLDHIFDIQVFRDLAAAEEWMGRCCPGG
jgi:hypothetical protein